MEILQSIELSPISLLAMFAIPFGYLVATGRYHTVPTNSKSLNFVFSLISLVASGFVLVTLAVQGWRSGMAERLMYLLHLGPPALTLLFISRLRDALDLKKLVQGQLAPGEDGESYAPKPQNDSIEKISWDDLIIGQKLRSELLSVIELLKEPARALEYGIDVPKGILLEGPPGTGKTTLAKVVANTAGLSFFALRMDQVVSKWVGESEKNLTKLFAAAQKHSPAVIFIDEVDSIGKRRGAGSAAHSDNLLNHLLQLIDGVVKTNGLYVIAATNRAELVDDALKRPGRLNKVIPVPLPNTTNRQKMFDLHLSKLKLASNVNTLALAEATHGASGAVIKAICNQAGLNSFQREAGLPKQQRTQMVSQEDLFMALQEFAGPQRIAV